MRNCVSEFSFANVLSTGFSVVSLCCLLSQAEIKFNDLSETWKDIGVLPVDNQCQPRGAVSKPVIPAISFEVSYFI